MTHAGKPVTHMDQSKRVTVTILDVPRAKIDT
jgi:hypothetical protein